MFRWMGNKMLDGLYWSGDILLQFVFAIGEIIFDRQF